MSEGLNHKKVTIKNVWCSAPMIIGYILTALIIIFWSVIFAHTPECTQKPCEGNWNNFWNQPPNEIGDTFAGLFGSLAFVWIVVTVFLQGHELREQRAEFEKMNMLSQEQSFETLVFSLIRQYSDLVETLDITTSSLVWSSGKYTHKLHTGRDCFEIFYKHFEDFFGETPGEEEELERIKAAYALFWDSHQSDLGHYFRFLYRSFKIISESPQSKKHHAKLLRSLLSEKELCVIFYNCLTPNGMKFKKLAEKYSIFDNLPEGILVQEFHRDFFEDEAFTTPSNGRNHK